MCKRLSSAAAEMLRADSLENSPVEPAAKRKPRRGAELRFSVDLSEQVIANVGLVYRVYATHFRGCERKYPGSRSDFIQEGMIALASAIRDYDSSRGAKLCTIATRTIRCKMLNLVQKYESAKRRDALAVNSQREPSTDNPLDRLIEIEELEAPV